MQILGTISSSKARGSFISSLAYQQSVYLNGAVFASKLSWANGAYRALVDVPTYGGNTSKCIFSSTDGNTWTLTASNLSVSPTDSVKDWIWYTSSGYYISIDGANGGSILYSTDLINWTSKKIHPTASSVFPYGDVSPSNGMWFVTNSSEGAWIASGNPTGSFSSGSIGVSGPNSLTWAGGNNWVASFNATGPTTQGIYRATSIGGSMTRMSGTQVFGIGRRKNAGLIVATTGSGTSYAYSTDNGSSWNSSSGSYAIGYSMDDDSSGTLFNNSNNEFINKFTTGGSISSNAINIAGVRSSIGQSRLAASSSATNVLSQTFETYIQSTNGGSTWTAKQATAGTTYGNFIGIVYAFGNFIALKVVNNYSSVRQITSTNGNTWTETDISGTYLLAPNSMSATGGYVYSHNSNNSIFVYNGTSWTNLSTPSGSYGTLVTGFASNGSVTIVGDAGGRIHSQTSVPNGGFTTNSGTVGTYIASVAFGNGIFVAGDNANGNVITSTNGTSGWTVRSTGGSSAVRVTFSSKAGLFIARAGSSTVYYTSPDGINWTARNHSAGNAAWIYRSTVDGIIGTGAGYIITSTDGINWSNSITGVSNGSLANELPDIYSSYDTNAIATDGAGKYRFVNNNIPILLQNL